MRYFNWHKISALQCIAGLEAVAAAIIAVLRGLPVAYVLVSCCLLLIVAADLWERPKPKPPADDYIQSMMRWWPGMSSIPVEKQQLWQDRMKAFAHNDHSVWWQLMNVGIGLILLLGTAFTPQP